MNCTNFIGRIGNDLELRQTPNGNKVLSFSLAVRRDNDNTDWIPVVCWNKTAELVANYCSKGSQLGVTGPLQTRQYQDKAGNNRTVYEVIANKVTLTGSKPNASTNAGDFEEIETDEADLPF